MSNWRKGQQGMKKKRLMKNDTIKMLIKCLEHLNKAT